MDYLKNYLDKIRANGKAELADGIQQTVDNVVPKYISNFTFSEHVVSLLVGDVQSGKTSHMFGIMCAAANEGFGTFVLLTTDNIILQQQTLHRAERDLSDFCVCSEEDYLKYFENNMQRPAVIVLKKNSSVLRQWKNNFASTHFAAGNPLFIVDDEADAASLNTLVNRKKQSTINKCLDDIKKTTSCSIYMQVTGTPQSILLQSYASGWKPYFIYYFTPGKGYMGGNFFFGSNYQKHIIFTDNAESKELLVDDEFPENGLKTALVMHLIISAHIMKNGGTVCNFLIHPSVKTSEHKKFAEKIGSYLNDVLRSFQDDSAIDLFSPIYNQLKQDKDSLIDLDIALDFIHTTLINDQVKILMLNSVSDYDSNTQYEEGVNIIIGGNSLGRGVTFPQLQIVYYCRVAKNPQADTMWQHARMFGYDRDPELLKVFMPPKLFKLFSDISDTNNSIIAQIKTDRNGANIKMYYPDGLRPTRKNVLDKKTVGMYSGNVNYFPFYPINKDISAIDRLMEHFDDGEYSVNMHFAIQLLGMMSSENNDWNEKAFIGFLNSFISENPLSQCHLIVRRNRDITRGTGTLLSPNDREIGSKITDAVVLTVYKVTGDKGWDGQQVWIPNIKLPGDVVYYSGENEEKSFISCT